MTLEPISLRLETPDGGQEYRIHYGHIECRELQSSDPDEEWRWLTPAEVSDHVRRNTVVSQWLRHRLGWRQLLVACTPQETLRDFGIHDQAGQHRAA